MGRRARRLSAAALAAALAFAASRAALAGAQQYEVLSAAVRASLAHAVADSPNVDLADMDTRAWVRAMTPRMIGRFPDERSTRRFLALVRYEAMRAGLDPQLVLAVMDVESHFRKYAVSKAGARGLMQVMPSVGQQVARSLGYPLWDPGLLFDPDANLELGVAHLASSIRQYDDIPRVLAAYNAGGSRVRRWETKPGADDPEIFAERIPFTETRDYVRIVQRNVELYRALYHW